MIIHIHIFKNAGSSFDSALKSNFHDKFTEHREDGEILNGKQGYLENFLKENINVKAFSSHSIHFVPESSVDFNFIPIYFLRHPVDRIRSVYSFEKQQLPADTQGSQKAKELTFEKYLEWYMEDTSPATIRNCQTIFLSGKGPSDKNMLDKHLDSLNLLNNKNIFIGIVDRYDESMIVFEEKLKEFFPDIDLSYLRKNVTDTDMKSSVKEKALNVLSKLPEKLAEEIVRKNEYDFLLYQKANQLLDEQISRMPQYQIKLKNFKDRCLVRQLRE